MSEKEKKDFSTIEVFIGQSVKQLITLIQESTEVSKKERKILSILLEYPETAGIIRNYLELNKQLGRRKEKAGLFGLERIAKAIKLSEKDKDKDDNRLRNMFKRMK